MKTETASRTGIIDAVAAGLRLAGRRPWLMLIPATIDVTLWLAPRLSIEGLLLRLLDSWEALLQAVYSQAQLTAINEMLGLFRDTVAQLGQHVNLMLALTSGWLAPTSAFATAQANRLLLISDNVLAPLGLGLQLPAAQPLAVTTDGIAVNSIGAVFLATVALWLIAQALATLFLRLAALSLDGVSAQENLEQGKAAPPPIRAVRVPLRRLFIRLLGLGLLLGTGLLLLRLPLAAVTALTMMTNSTASALAFVISGGMTLWLTMSFLISMFFASDALALDGKGLWASIWHSFLLTRHSGLRTLGFVILVNLLALGARAVWGLIGQAPLGAAVAILGNAYLATGIILASIIYYDGLRREWQASVAVKVEK